MKILTVANHIAILEELEKNYLPFHQAVKLSGKPTHSWPENMLLTMK